MAEIRITPKLGPYGSGPLSVGVNVDIDLMPEVKQWDDPKVAWDKLVYMLNRVIKIEVDANGHASIVRPESKK